MQRWQRVAHGVGQYTTLHYRHLLLLLVLLGVFLRVWQYSACISFWGDEAYLIYNVQNHSAGELIGSLDLQQTAPPAFLIGAKMLGGAMGINEFSARLIPLLSGCLALVLFTWLAVRLLTPTSALIVVAMFALSDKLIEHSADFKQYSSDALVCVVLLCIAAIGREKRSALWRLAVLCLVAAPLFWLSEASVFVFAGLSLALVAQMQIQRPKRLLAYAALNLVPIASFALLYVASIRHQQYPGLYEFWHKQLFDYAQWYLYPLWLIRGLHLVANFAMRPLGPVILGFAVAGFVGLRRNDRQPLSWLLVAPILVVVAAATARAYPMGGRVTLFLAPCVLLLVTCGFDFIAKRLAYPSRGLVGLAIIAVMGSALVPDLWAVYRPRCVSHIRPAVRYLQAHRLPGEPVYMVGSDTFNCARVYWTDMPQPYSSCETLTTPPTEATFWLFFEFAPEQWARKRKPSLDVCASVADVVDRFELPGGWAVKYHRRER